MTEQIKCSLFPKCGGCQLLNQTYQETLRFKLDLVNTYLKEQKIDHYVHKILPANQNLAYRNKMILAFRKVSGRVISGFYEENSHQVVDLKECLMHSTIQNQIAFGIKTIIETLKIPPYDEDKRVGLIRYIIIKEAVSTKEILVVIVTSVEVFPARNEFVKRIRNLSNNIKSIIQNVNSRKTSIVLGDKERVLFGKGFVYDELMHLRFPISSKSFYQVNPAQTIQLYSLVKEYLNPEKNEILVDAYSGVGTIGMIMADSVKQVISVENNKQAVMIGINNAKFNQIKNIQFYCDDATNFIKKLADERVKIDCLIMDPPRSGSTLEFLHTAVSLKPKKIIYVSCGPDTLARDLRVFCSKEYQIIKSCCVDMFCWTKHVETVMLLCLKEPKIK